MIWIYCRTTDSPKEVGKYICKSNFNQEDNEVELRITKDVNEEECWLLETNLKDERVCWGFGNKGDRER